MTERADLFQASPMTLDAIRGWSLSDALLPARVVRCCTGAGLEQVGLLMVFSPAKLSSLAGLGRRSEAAVRDRLDQLERMTRGELRFSDLDQALGTLLNADEQNVLTMRYGLDRVSPGVSRTYFRLEEIGRASGRTRERIRQVESNALAALRTPFAAAVLAPFRERIEACLRERDGAAAPAELEQEAGLVPPARLHAASVALLFADLGHGPLRFHRGIFLLGDPCEADRELEAAARRLAEAGEPLPVERMARGSARRLRLLLEYREGVLVTRDGRAILRRSKAFDRFLEECIDTLPHPARYAAVADACNRLLKPPSHLKPMAVARALNRHPRIRRVSFGYYARP
jgi:hypothetical protein